MKDATKAKTQDRNSSQTAMVNITKGSIGVNEPELDGNSFDNYSIDGKKIKQASGGGTLFYVIAGYLISSPPIIKIV